MKLALAQINPTVGALMANTAKIIALIEEARQAQVDLIVFPELAITGYPPEDLLLKPQFIDDNLACLKKIVAKCSGLAVYLGFVDQDKGKLFNAGAFVDQGKIKGVYHKVNLPNYSVFDEKRYFSPGTKPLTVTVKGKKIGLGICEDIWVESGPYAKGLDLILNINASPFHFGKIRERQTLLSKRAKELKTTIVYVNMVGGQDELVFDGGSMVIDQSGRLQAACDQYREELLIFDLDQDWQDKHAWAGPEAEIYYALVLGVKDYLQKNAFPDAVIGLSGGIDSALTLAIAVDALGQKKVHAVFMPSAYSSLQSRTDALKLATDLGVDWLEIPINKVMDQYLGELAPAFKHKPANIAEENLQARIRGNYLMALSNKHGWLVLTTGNKSEMSTGYCTMYGDMAGGFAVLKDVPKTLVYKLARWRNQHGGVIPQPIIDRPPSAELKPNQLDQDTLPPYDQLDAVMKAYVEENRSPQEIIAAGFPISTVNNVIKMIDQTEYKRRQSPPGPRITPRAFGKDWRLPITNGYK
ncbi:NAD+ synthase [candidate division WOR-1 bacterium RIFOXYB2_FULL_48_7]|uniref:Glutamine-dependent NAD(+) synthetase n=1 Tax=candidate division WOR-1 bacterium RIFOXYB2_FULL_48_7 TaxID=1802583 RepID=A0A1F4TLF5_UNCSA|nr:MAG: NAD+ synthase [candidate division WOR-1 bacterium RIFOXYB2_FULL_48_7]